MRSDAETVPWPAANDGFPGTTSISFDAVRLVAVDIARSLRRSGFPCLVIVNGDVGNQAPLRQAARDVVWGDGWPVLVLDYPGLAAAASEVCDTPPAGPGFYHADEVETSIMLAVRPELVDLGRAAAEYPELPVTQTATPTRLRDVSSSGVFGDPTAADADKGRRLLDLLVVEAVAVARAFVASAVGGD